MPEAETIKRACRYCGKLTYHQSDDPFPTCKECDDIESQYFEDSWQAEETILDIAVNEPTRTRRNS